MSLSREYDSLVSYLDAVDAFIDHTVRRAGLHSEQVELLCPKNWTSGRKTGKVLAHPLAPFYFAIRSHGLAMTEYAVAIGASYRMFHRSVRWIDDIQDNELTELQAKFGGGVIINGAVTLLLLAIDVLWAVELEGTGKLGRELNNALRAHAIRLSHGQHRDLTGRGRFSSPAETIEIAVEKSAIFTLLMEYAAICVAAASPNPVIQNLEPYRVMGDALAKIQQIVNDISDLFGESDSNDLSNGTWNIPLAVLLDTAPEEGRQLWKERLAKADQKELCRLIYASGTMTELAGIVEDARIQIHKTCAELPCDGPYLAMLLAWLDDMAALLYRPDVLDFSIDMDAVDTYGLHPADAVLFEQLRTGLREVRQLRRSA